MVCPLSLDHGDKNANTKGMDKLPCQLRHPRTNKAASFICTNDGVFEVNYFKPKTSCWFIGETIRSDGTLLVVTPMDPLFLVIPYLSAASKSSSGKNFMLLEQTLVDEDFEAVGKRLLPVFSSESHCSQLQHIADVKTIDGSDSPAVRFSESKCLAWLEKKVRTLAATLKERNVDIHGSRSASLIVTKEDVADAVQDSKDEISQDLLRYAYEVVSEYLSYALKIRLGKHLKIADDTEALPSSDVTPPVAKKAKTGAAEEPAEDYSKAATPFSPASNKKPATKAAKDLAKASKGTASVMSFFKATPKK